MSHNIDSITGFVFGLILGMAIGHVFHRSALDNMIEKCESTLPRAQKCVISAVPENTGEK